MYLRNYLSHLQRATAEGIPVKGYFLWSPLDNFGHRSSARHIVERSLLETR